MKNYPRIYSLSTLGLIHHYENDYLFHNMRTDFVGDSGSGKSIIADPKANLMPIGQPLQTKDFKREGNICPLDDLLSQMEEKGLFLSYWETVKPYHRILYTHDILSLIHI